MNNGDKIRSMSNEELVKEFVSMYQDTIDGDIIPGRYSYRTSHTAGYYSNRKEAEEAELNYLNSEVE